MRKLIEKIAFMVVMEILGYLEKKYNLSNKYKVLTKILQELS